MVDLQDRCLYSRCCLCRFVTTMMLGCSTKTKRTSWAADCFDANAADRRRLSVTCWCTYRCLYSRCLVRSWQCSRCYSLFVTTTASVRRRWAGWPGSTEYELALLLACSDTDWCIRRNRRLSLCRSRDDDSRVCSRAVVWARYSFEDRRNAICDSI